MKVAVITLISVIVLAVSACNGSPTPIRYGQDAGAFCRMTIVDQRFGGELLTRTGKVYKFDSVSCLASFVLERTVPETEIGSIWVTDFNAPPTFIPVERAVFVLSDKLRSPMGAGLAAVRASGDPAMMLAELDGVRVSWEEVLEYVAAQRDSRESRSGRGTSS